MDLYTPAPQPLTANKHTTDNQSVAGTDDAQSQAPLWFGLSALAALSIAIGLLIARRRQQNARRRGERIPLPEGAAAATEAQVWESADVATTQNLDVALRHLADHCRTTGQPLPTLMGVNLAAGEVSLALLSPIDLPEPWILDTAGGWSVNPADLPPTPPSAVSPYPALVAVGTTDIPTTVDEEDGDTPAATSTLLLNLEHFGHLAVTSPTPAAAQAAVQSMAWELALSPLADNLDLTLVGLGEEMPALIDSGRVDYAPTADDILDQLDHTTRLDAGLLASQGVDSIAQARTSHLTSEVTAPHILLLADPLTPEQADRLDQIRDRHPRLAFAAVTATADPAADWTLRVHDDIDADLAHTASELTIPIHPQLITAAGHRDLVTIQTTALAEPLPATEPDIAWAADDIDTTLTTNPAALLDVPPTVYAVNPDPDLDTEDLDVITATDRTLAATAIDDLPDLSAHLWIHMLGRPNLTPLSGAEAPDRRGPLLTELAVLLSQHAEHGLAHTDIDAAIWPKSPHNKIRDAKERATKKAQTRNQAFSRLRKWLGATESGDEAFPKVGDRTGRARYRLHPDVISDWDRWQTLIETTPRGFADPARTSNSRLTAALEMVTGSPFSNVSPDRYGWASHLQQEMISALTDAAEELAARAIHTGDLPAAADIAAKGIEVDTAHEGCWRLAIIAAHAQGQHDLAQQHIDRMLGETAELELELDDETITLLRELGKARDEDGDRQYEIAS